LITSFGNRTRRLRNQALLEFEIFGDKYEHVFLVSQKLIAPLLLGIYLLCENEIIFDLKNGYLRRETGGELKSYPIRPQLTEGVSEAIEQESESHRRQEIAKFNHIQIPKTGKLSHLDVTQSAETECGAELFPHGISGEHNGQSRKDPVLKTRNALGTEKHNPSVAVRNDVDEDNEMIGQRPKFTIYNINRESNGSLITGNTTHYSNLSGPRCASLEAISQLSNSINTLSPVQKTELRDLLSNYREHFTSKPGRCGSYEYEYKLNDTAPYIGHTGPVPFSLRPAIRDQLHQMVEDGIIEPAMSPYINPLTIVPRPGKTRRISVDARKVN
jgi:hypothetical protein